MRRRRLVLRVGPSTLRAEVTRGPAVLWQAAWGFSTEEGLVSALGNLRQGDHVSGIMSAQVELEVPFVQVRTLSDLPPVRRSALRRLVAHQAGRFFRKNGKPLVTNAAWQPGPRGAPRTAIAAAIEEPWLDALIQGSRAVGIEAASISPAGLRLDLLPGGERAARDRAAIRRLRRLAVVAAALWGLVLVLAVGRTIRDAGSVERELEALSPVAVAARRVRQEYAGGAAMAETLATAARTRGNVAAHIAAILLSLPDSAYLTTVHVASDSTGEVTGAARRPLDVVAALDRTRVVDAARLVGAGSRIPVGGKDYESFTLRFGRDSAR